MSVRTRIDRSTAPRLAAAEPQPWQHDDDAAGWRTVYHGRARRRPVPITVEVELDDAQSAWVKEEARRAGVDYASVIRRAVDAARGGA
jgi:hypothetical protein